MDLLHEIPNELKYKFITTNRNIVFLITYKYTAGISEEDLNTNFNLVVDSILDGKIEDTSKTEEYNTPADEYYINKLNERIIDYCNKYAGAKQINLVSGDGVYKMIYEPKVFQTMVSCSSDLRFDLKECAIRTDSYKYGNVEKITFDSGVWFLDDDTTVIVKDIIFNKCEVNAYNGSNEFSKGFNLLIGRRCEGTQLKIYSTIKSTIQFSKDVFNIPFNSSRLSIPYLTFFGQEVVSSDINNPRCLIAGFFNVYIGNVIISEEVQYGSLIKFDKITSVSVCGLQRKVTGLNRKGDLITVDQVGKFKLYNIEYETDNSSTLYKGSSIVYVINSVPNSGLKRKIQLFDSNIENNSSSEDITILKVAHTDIDLLYVTDCIIGSGVNIIEADGYSNVTKLSYNDTEMIIKGSFKFSNVDQVLISGCTLDVHDEFTINSQSVSLIDSILKFEKMIIENEFIDKISINNCELLGSRLFMYNREENESFIYSKDSKYRIEKINIDKYTCSFIGGMIKSTACIINGKSTSIDSTLLSIIDNYKQLNLQFNSSLVGNILLDDLDPNFKIFIDVNDVDFFFKTSNIDISALGSVPKIRLATNTPLKTKLINFTNSRIYYKLLDTYDSIQSSKIIKEPTYNETSDFKVINNSELISTISESIDDYGVKTFTINKK
jgi:hypothetical protein